MAAADKPNGISYAEAILGDLKDRMPTAEEFGTEKHVRAHLRPNRFFRLGSETAPLCQLNWVVSLIASVFLWTFVIACAVVPADARLAFGFGQSFITQNFTWLYIGTNDAWAIFFIWLCFSRFGSMKLGLNDQEKPEFSDSAWFAMLFTCGVAIGMFTFGVSEPMFYYRAGYSNRLNKLPIDNDDQRAQQALTLTLFHWGIHGYIPYVVATLAMGLPAYRWGLPLTVRTAFYPLAGDLTKGLLGDIVDAISIACTTFGVCTSLGLGAETIAAGIAKLRKDPALASSIELQAGLVWIITVIATGSVVLGLKRGIKNLSYFAFGIGSFLIVVTMMFDNPWFLLNSYVQSVGHYFQWILQLGFSCDTWEQLAYELEGRKNVLMQYYRGPHSWWAQAEEKGMHPNPWLASQYYGSHTKYWIDWWTIFYWGWWISWAPFVGMFVAKISRGRTIRQIVLGTMFAPVTYVFLWMVVFGSLGIKMQRIAEVALEVKPDVYDGSVDCAAMGYDGAGNPVSAKAKALADIGYYALACRPHSSRTYDIFEPYGGEGLTTFMWVVVIVGLVVYFITSSDSGSMVDDVLAAGGISEPPVPQKVYWAFTEGATCTALLMSGGATGLGALQAASIIAGFPYTVAICFMCTSIMRVVKIEAGDDDIFTQTRFNSGLFDFFDGFNPHVVPGQLKCSTPGGGRALIMLRNLFFPFTGVYNVVKTVGSPSEAMVQGGGAALLWLAWFALLIADVGEEAVAIVGWGFFLVLMTQIAILRVRVRVAYKVFGNVAEDFTCSMVWMASLAQLELHVLDGTRVEEEPHMVEHTKPLKSEYEGGHA